MHFTWCKSLWNNDIVGKAGASVGMVRLQYYGMSLRKMCHCKRTLIVTTQIQCFLYPLDLYSTLNEVKLSIFKITALFALATVDCYKLAPTHHTTSCLPAQRHHLNILTWKNLKFRKNIIGILGKITDFIQNYTIYSKYFLTHVCWTVIKTQIKVTFYCLLYQQSCKIYSVTEPEFIFYLFTKKIRVMYLAATAPVSAVQCLAVTDYDNWSKS